MRYSLLSRFQGALLGAVVGDQIGAYLSQSRSPVAQHYPWHPGLGNTSAESAATSWQGRGAIVVADEILHYGSLAGLALVPTSRLATLVQNSAARSTGELAIVALPLLLFCHDSPTKLRQSLELLVPPSQEERLGHLFSYACILSQVLQERWDPLAWVPQTIHQLRQVGFSSTIQQSMTVWLDQIHQCCQQKLSLEQATAELLPAAAATSSSGEIALALYGFLSVPTDCMLGLLRSAQSTRQPATVAALTGTLAGAHNSVVDIPLEWLAPLLDDNQSLSWGVSGKTVQTLAVRLLASWSGIYDPTGEVTLPPIAAAGVIRPR